MYAASASQIRQIFNAEPKAWNTIHRIKGDEKANATVIPPSQDPKFMSLRFGVPKKPVASMPVLVSNRRYA